MINLLNANLTRVKKAKLFKILSFAIILVTIFMIINQYLDSKYASSPVQYDSLYNFLLVFIGILISIFTGIFLSTEYFDGTLKNKIIIGHKRINIYLANLMTIIIVSLFFEIIFVILITIVGIPLFGFNILSLNNFIYSIIMTQLIIIANASIYTFIAMVCTNGMLINVLCILIAFGSYFTTLILMNILETPEYITSAQITDTGGNIEYIKEKNPKYPSATKKQICNTILDIVPQSESIRIVSDKIPNKNLVILYSISTSLIITGCGIIIFKKKELK